MFTPRKKIHKDNDAMQALFDLKNTNQEIKSDPKDLYIRLSTQLRKLMCLQNEPYQLRKPFRKIHARLVREVEKFSGKDVVIATQRIMRPPKKGSAAQRPSSCTLTAVHDAMLENVVYPAEIVGKCI